MRRFLATLLLVCFGIIVPTAAFPVRICLLEKAPLAAESGAGHSHSPKCCSDCGPKDESCCADLKQLPDTTLPSVFPDLVPLIAWDLPPSFFLYVPEGFPLENVYHASVPIRGPDRDSPHRAVLSVWRI